LSNIKEAFGLEYQKLDKMEEHLTEEQFSDAKKKLMLYEENLLREAELKLGNAHKTEEAALRKELEKKHAAEQVAFRKEMADKQGKLRTQLIGDSDIADQENEQDRKALEKYEAQKKVEQDRRLRAIEAQKK